MFFQKGKIKMIDNLFHEPLLFHQMKNANMAFSHPNLRLRKAIINVTLLQMFIRIEYKLFHQVCEFLRPLQRTGICNSILKIALSNLLSSTRKWSQLICLAFLTHDESK